MEVFKSVEGYEDAYLISNKGRIWSNRTKKYLSPLPTRDGYYRYALSKNGVKTYLFAHRLVAMAFLPNPCGYPQINHKDEDKTNNSVENLEWCDVGYNLSYGARMTKISTALKNYPGFSKKVLCVETGVVYASIREAVRQTGITKQHLSAACNKKPGVKTAGGFHWKFFEEAS